MKLILWLFPCLLLLAGAILNYLPYPWLADRLTYTGLALLVLEVALFCYVVIRMNIREVEDEE